MSESLSTSRDCNLRCCVIYISFIDCFHNKNLPPIQIPSYFVVIHHKRESNKKITNIGLLMMEYYLKLDAERFPDSLCSHVYNFPRLPVNSGGTWGCPGSGVTRPQRGQGADRVRPAVLSESAGNNLCKGKVCK